MNLKISFSATRKSLKTKDRQFDNIGVFVITTTYFANNHDEVANLAIFCFKLPYLQSVV